MKRIIIFIFLSILNFNYANSEECGFGFEIGDNFSEVTESYGEIDLDHAENMMDVNLSQELKNLLFVEIDFKVLCPDYEGLDFAKVKIYSLGDDKVGGFEVFSNVHISEVENKNQLLSNYIAKNYGNLVDVDKVDDPNWLGNTSWEANNMKYYYNKIKKFNKLIVEDLLITNNEFRKYF